MDGQPDQGSRGKRENERQGRIATLMRVALLGVIRAVGAVSLHSKEGRTLSNEAAQSRAGPHLANMAGKV